MYALKIRGMRSCSFWDAGCLFKRFELEIVRGTTIGVTRFIRVKFSYMIECRLGDTGSSGVSGSPVCRARCADARPSLGARHLPQESNIQAAAPPFILLFPSNPYAGDSSRLLLLVFTSTGSQHGQTYSYTTLLCLYLPYPYSIATPQKVGCEKRINVWYCGTKAKPAGQCDNASKIGMYYE
jgi:hypothetical protein